MERERERERDEMEVKKVRGGEKCDEGGRERS